MRAHNLTRPNAIWEGPHPESFMRTILTFLALTGCVGSHGPEGGTGTATGPDKVTSPIAATPVLDAAGLANQVAELRKSPDAASQWQLAVALARLRALEGACAHGATMDAILDALEAAVAGDASLAAGINTEPALAEVKTTVRAQILLGANLGDAATLERVVSDASWYGPPSGVLPSTGTLDLNTGGVATGTSRVLGDSGPVDTAFSGTWTAAPARPGVDLTTGGHTVPYALTTAGVLTASGGGWLNLPSECGA